MNKNVVKNHVNHAVIKETVEKLVKHADANQIALLLKEAISLHQNHVHYYPTLEYRNHFYYFSSVEVIHGEIEQPISLLKLKGYKCTNNKLDPSKKICRYVKKDSDFIQQLFIILYTNIASVMRV